MIFQIIRILRSQNQGHLMICTMSQKVVSKVRNSKCEYGIEKEVKHIVIFSIKLSICIRNHTASHFSNSSNCDSYQKCCEKTSFTKKCFFKLTFGVSSHYQGDEWTSSRFPISFSNESSSNFRPLLKFFIQPTRLFRLFNLKRIFMSK